MRLFFLVLFWCSAVVARCGGPNILGDNSRFGVFNSRLGRGELPVRTLREFAGKGLIYPTILAARRQRSGQNRQNSRFFGKNREFASTAAAATWFPWDRRRQAGCEF